MFHLNLYLQNPMNEEFNEIAILDVADVAETTQGIPNSLLTITA